MPDAAQVEGQPETQRSPGRIGEKTRQRDSPEVAPGENFAERGPRAVALKMLFLSRQDMPLLLTRERRMSIGRAIEEQPESGPDQPQAAGEQKSRAPVVRQDGPSDERRGKHRAHRRSDV